MYPSAGTSKLWVWQLIAQMCTQVQLLYRCSRSGIRLLSGPACYASYKLGHSQHLAVCLEGQGPPLCQAPASCLAQSPGVHSSRHCCWACTGQRQPVLQRPCLSHWTSTSISASGKDEHILQPLPMNLSSSFSAISYSMIRLSQSEKGMYCSPGQLTC